MLYDCRNDSLVPAFTLWDREDLEKDAFETLQPNREATHVVTGILYGSHAFFVLDREVSEEEDRQEIEGNLKVLIKKIPMLDIEGKGALKMEDADFAKVDKFSSVINYAVEVYIDDVWLQHMECQAVDTPGFGDTRGIDRDREITEQISCPEEPWKKPTVATVTAVATVTLLLAVLWSVGRCRAEGCHAHFQKQPLPLSL
ncbi:hypothetical protein NHX12_004588, partial [Muraenolepis orangiensis]